MKVSNSGTGSTDRLRDSIGTGNTGAVKGESGRRRAEQGADSEPTEKVAISSRAKDIAKAKEVASSTPDIDEARVARLKAAIQSGSYKADADKIADRLVDEHLSTVF